MSGSAAQDLGPWLLEMGVVTRAQKIDLELQMTIAGNPEVTASQMLAAMLREHQREDCCLSVSHRVVRTWMQRAKEEQKEIIMAQQMSWRSRSGAKWLSGVIMALISRSQLAGLMALRGYQGKEVGHKLRSKTSSKVVSQGPSRSVSPLRSERGASPSGSPTMPARVTRLGEWLSDVPLAVPPELHSSGKPVDEGGCNKGQSKHPSDMGRNRASSPSSQKGAYRGKSNSPTSQARHERRSAPALGRSRQPTSPIRPRGKASVSQRQRPLEQTGHQRAGYSSGDSGLHAAAQKAPIKSRAQSNLEKDPSRWQAKQDALDRAAPIVVAGIGDGMTEVGHSEITSSTKGCEVFFIGTPDMSLGLRP